MELLSTTFSNGTEPNQNLLHFTQFFSRVTNERERTELS